MRPSEGRGGACRHVLVITRGCECGHALGRRKPTGAGAWAHRHTLLGVLLFFVCAPETARCFPVACTRALSARDPRQAHHTSVSFDARRAVAFPLASVRFRQWLCLPRTCGTEIALDTPGAMFVRLRLARRTLTDAESRCPIRRRAANAGGHLSNATVEHSRRRKRRGFFYECRTWPRGATNHARA